MERKKLLITGCGRSGTLYTTEVWRSLGLDIRHERPIPTHGSMGRDGAASWFMAVDDRNPPFGPSTAGYKFDFVLHVVRNPLKVIASVAQFILQKGAPSPEYIERHAPETRLSFEERTLEPKQQFILRAARYWYHWNLLAEAKADQTFQVEQLASALPGLCDHLGVEYRPGQADKVPKDTNARWHYLREEPWVVNWADIEALDPSLCNEIRHLAASYGY
ncbi:MAG: hypothetical protein JRF69_01840 [Deltaproteobacteria bacterium]|nr:hypothetical protein [Deltaproteobacteria bacterium]